MDISVQLKRSHSSNNAKVVAEYVLQHSRQFKVLVGLCLVNDEDLAKRAAWALGMAGQQKPELLEDCLADIIPALQQQSHPAIKRNFYRVLQEMDIPEDFQGIIFGLALQEVANPAAPAAIRAFAMSTAFRIVQKQPVLARELELTISDSWEGAPKAFHSRGRKILKYLDKVSSTS